MNKKAHNIFLIGDGDMVGRRIDNYLLNGELEYLTRYSKMLRKAIAKIVTDAEELMDARIILAGGDDILMIIREDKFLDDIVERFRETFKSLTGGSISFGKGNTIEDAIIDLKRKKADIFTY